MLVYSNISLSQRRNLQKGIKLANSETKIVLTKHFNEGRLAQETVLDRYSTFRSFCLFTSWTLGRCLFTCVMSRRWSMARSWSTLFGLSWNLLKLIIRSSYDSFLAWQELVVAALCWHPTVGINPKPEWRTFFFFFFFVVFFVQTAFSTPRCRSHQLIQAIKSVNTV